MNTHILMLHRQWLSTKIEYENSIFLLPNTLSWRLWCQYWVALVYIITAWMCCKISDFNTAENHHYKCHLVARQYCMQPLVLNSLEYFLSSEQISTCDSPHSWRFYSAAPLADQATYTMTQFPIQSDYLDTELTSPCPTLVMPNTRLGRNAHRFCKFLACLRWIPKSQPSAQEARTLHIRTLYTPSLHCQWP